MRHDCFIKKRDNTHTHTYTTIKPLQGIYCVGVMQAQWV